MLRNYLKSAWRNLTRHRLTSFTNLFGITIGLTCCLLILCYILNETSYDKFRNANNIYRVTRSFYTESGKQTLHLGSVAPVVGPLLQHDFPDIKEMTRVLDVGTLVFKYGEKQFNETGAFFADTSFFDFFSVPVLKGNPRAALDNPFSVMLTPDIAKKYFGNEDPMNKMIRVSGNFLLKVTGIFQPLPSNSHLHPDILISFNTLKDSTIYGEKRLETSWDNNAFFTYLMFPPGYPVQNIEKQFPDFLNRHVHFDGMPPGYVPAKTSHLYLQKLRDIHLRSHLDSEIEENGDINRVYIFSAIALFILLIACINYMNLATARSILRAREIGIRKVVGAQKREVILQFLGESLLITFISLILAILLTALLLPYLNRLADRELNIILLLQWKIVMAIFLLPLVVGLISGLYPALFMSAFRPVTVLKGVLKTGRQYIPVRQALVVLQFTISIVLIIATAVVFQQLRYVQRASLGFNKDHILTMPYDNGLDNRFDAFRSVLLQDPSVKAIGLSSRIPSGRLLDEMGVKTFGTNTRNQDNFSLKYVTVNDHFMPAYQIPVIAGRNFDRRSFPTDTAGFMINNAAVKMFGWGNAKQAIGKDLKYGGILGKVIGVTGDFHFESMHQQIIPLIFVPGSIKDHSFNLLSIKISGAQIPATIDKIKKAWESFLPQTPFSYQFLDDRFASLYKAERKEETIFTIFSCIAIFIACLGLFGLSAFTISQRVKEIGIRKVLGASIGNIATMLSKDFMKLVGIAALIALPLGWYYMHRWLQGFAYHIDVQWWVLLLAGILAVLIALVTIGLQAIRAAEANPVEALRSE